MRHINRREFIGAGAIGLAASAMFGKQAFGLPRIDAPIAFQSWGMKDQLSEDFDGTLAQIRDLGYTYMEMCSPRSYGQFAFLRDLSGEELANRISSSGITTRTCHFSSRELLGDAVGGTIEYGKDLGLQHLTMSSAGVREEDSLDAWKTFAERANTAGEEIKAAGLQLVYHNHAIGPEIEGKPLFDHLMELFDPELVGMQFQLASISGGYDIVSYLDKYAGRYVALHMHDWDPNQGGIVPIGDGVIDWPALFAAARKSNLAEWGLIVEIETEEPLEGLVRSYDYLSKLQV